MINIQNQNEQEQIIQQSIPNFQEKDFYSFLEPGEQKEYLSFRNIKGKNVLDILQ